MCLSDAFQLIRKMLDFLGGKRLLHHVMSGVPAVNTDDVDLNPLALVVFAKFPHCKVTTPSVGAYFHCPGFPSCASRVDMLCLHRN